MITTNKVAAASRSNAAFTIVELLIVVVVVAILAAVTIVAYNGITNRALRSGQETHLSDLIKKVEMFNVTNSGYPSYIGEIDGSKAGDSYLFLGTRYCVSSTDSRGKVYSRMSDSKTVNESLCANVAPSYALAPESCFQFNAPTNEITLYYANQGNNAANPACPLELTVPATIGGTAVRVISQGGFASTKVKSVVLPNGLLTIIDGAFNYSDVSYVYIPPTVTTIGGGGFAFSKLNSVYIPASVASIGCGVFGNMASLKVAYVGLDSTASSSPLSLSCAQFSGNAAMKSISFGQHVTNLDGGVISNSPSLTSLTIQDGARPLTIGSITGEQTAIVDLTLPGRVSSIQYGAFAYAASLRKLVIEDGGPALSIGTGAFQTTGLTSIDLPGRTSLIDGGAFTSSVNLETVILRDGITELSINGGFYDTAIKSLALPGRTKEVTGGAFRDLATLTSLTIQSGSTNLSLTNDAFSGSSLQSVAFPARVKLIGGYAFADTPTLTAVTFQTGITTINDNAFNSTGLTSVAIPTATVVSANAFPPAATITRF